MATKKAIAVNRAFLRGKRQGKLTEEKHVLGFLTAVIIVLLFLLFAQHFGWWPYSREKLGTAFYTNVSAATPAKTLTTSGTGSTGSAGSAGTPGSNGASSSGSSGSSSGSSSGTSAAGPIATFAANVNVGNTSAQTTAQANGLSQNCSIVANTGVSDTGLGQQQVCVYTQGSKIVTITYLNGRVISASKSGF